MTRLLVSLLVLGAFACSPTKPTQTCFDPRVVIVSPDGTMVGMKDAQGVVHFVPRTLPICRPEDLR